MPDGPFMQRPLTSIDAWARRSADTVCAAAASYAAKWHDQPHRGRRDMHTLQRGPSPLPRADSAGIK